MTTKREQGPIDLMGMETLHDDVRADCQSAASSSHGCQRRVEAITRRLHAARVATFLLLVGCTATAGAWMMSPALPPAFVDAKFDDVVRVLRESRNPRERQRAIDFGALSVVEFIGALKDLPVATIPAQADASSAIRRIREAISR